jgi:hypothetical protein
VRPDYVAVRVHPRLGDQFRGRLPLRKEHLRHTKRQSPLGLIDNADVMLRGDS